MQDDYFFDTYALVEFIEGSENYRRFQETPIITALYNIYELVYYLLRDHDTQTAEKTIDRLNYNLVAADEEDLYSAARFKLDNRDQQLSHVDCLGYVLARKNDLKFLTGDREFESKENVEYVK